MASEKYNCSLAINDFELPVYLGVSVKERAKKQKILITAKINFASPPRACKTGQISDTICYDTLIQKIKKFCHNKKFTLIELLGAQLFVLIKQSIYKDCELYLHIAKLYPLKDLAQSTFEISSFRQKLGF